MRSCLEHLDVPPRDGNTKHRLQDLDDSTDDFALAVREGLF